MSEKYESESDTSTFTDAPPSMPTSFAALPLVVELPRSPSGGLASLAVAFAFAEVTSSKPTLPVPATSCAPTMPPPVSRRPTVPAPKSGE